MTIFGRYTYVSLALSPMHRCLELFLVFYSFDVRRLFIAILPDWITPLLWLLQSPFLAFIDRALEVTKVICHLTSSRKASFWAAITWHLLASYRRRFSLLISLDLYDFWIQVQYVTVGAVMLGLDVAHKTAKLWTKHMQIRAWQKWLDNYINFNYIHGLEWTPSPSLPWRRQWQLHLWRILRNKALPLFLKMLPKQHVGSCLSSTKLCFHARHHLPLLLTDCYS